MTAKTNLAEEDSIVTVIPPVYSSSAQGAG